MEQTFTDCCKLIREPSPERLKHGEDRTKPVINIIFAFVDKLSRVMENLLDTCIFGFLQVFPGFIEEGDYFSIDIGCDGINSVTEE